MGKHTGTVSVAQAPLRNLLRERGGGTHNRRARRAAKAIQGGLFSESDAEFASKREKRRRAEREAFWVGKTDADVEAMALKEAAASGVDMTFVALLAVAVPGWVERHWNTDPKVREARATELGETIAYSQGAAAICDPEARGTEIPGEAATVFNAIAEGLAIGAFCPGGSSLAGFNWRVEDGKLRTTMQTFCSQVALEAL